MIYRSLIDVIVICPDYLLMLQKFGGMGDDAMDDIDESDDGMCAQICG